MVVVLKYVHPNLYSGTLQLLKLLPYSCKGNMFRFVRTKKRIKLKQSGNVWGNIFATGNRIFATVPGDREIRNGNIPFGPAGYFGL
jgi:hypothetical protein